MPTAPIVTLPSRMEQSAAARYGRLQLVQLDTNPGEKRRFRKSLRSDTAGDGLATGSAAVRGHPGGATSFDRVGRHRFADYSCSPIADRRFPRWAFSAS